MHFSKVVGIVLVLVLLFPSAGEARKGCSSSECIERVFRKACSQTNVKACIRRATIRHRQSYSDALRVARCESTLNPRATSSGGHYGLYQFLGSTWATTPYGFRWIYSAKWNSLAAMWAWKVGRRGEWACR